MPNNVATRQRHVIEWVNEHGTPVNITESSTRERRARRHLERLRGTQHENGWTLAPPNGWQVGRNPALAPFRWFGPPACPPE